METKIGLPQLVGPVLTRNPIQKPDIKNPQRTLRALAGSFGPLPKKCMIACIVARQSRRTCSENVQGSTSNLEIPRQNGMEWRSVTSCQPVSSFFGIRFSGALRSVSTSVSTSNRSAGRDLQEIASTVQQQSDHQVVCELRRKRNASAGALGGLWVGGQSKPIPVAPLWVARHLELVPFLPVVLKDKRKKRKIHSRSSSREVRIRYPLFCSLF